MTDTEALALRILDWDERFEVNSFKREFLLGLNQEKRKLPLPFVRRPALDLGRTEEQQEFLNVAGPWHAGRVEGFYYTLAAKKERDFRGWLLNRRLEPIGAIEIAAALGLPVVLVAGDIETLRKMRLIEWQPCKFAADCGQPVKMSLSDEDIKACESLPSAASFATRYITEPEPELEHNLTDLDKDYSDTRKGKAADTPPRGGVVAGCLAGKVLIAQFQRRPQRD